MTAPGRVPGASAVRPAGASALETGAAAGWRAHLSLHYTRDGDRTGALDRHSGPLRVLQRLYPEGPGICHHVLVHPPGGVVGGDVLELDARLDEATHAVLTTPGATRFYRSDGATAVQSARVALAAGARLEWLPMESIAHRGCIAHNRLHLSLAEGAEALGWDLLALGLPASGDQFDTGRYLQHLEVQGAWLERGLVDAADQRQLHSPLGLAGRRVLATMWFAAGASPARCPARRRPRRAGRRPAVPASRCHGGASACGGVARPGRRCGAGHGPDAPRAHGLARAGLAARQQPAAPVANLRRPAQDPMPSGLQALRHRDGTPPLPTLNGAAAPSHRACVL
jgi:urease accessory protein